MRSWPRNLLGAVLLVGVSAAIGAQPPTTTLPVGARVRVEKVDGKHVVGVLLASEPDSLRLSLGRRVDGVERYAVFPRDSVRSYTQSEGHDRGRGALIGAGVGAVVGGALIAWAAYADAHNTSDQFITASQVAAPAALGIVGIGALVGSFAGPEVWGPPMTLRVGSGPAATTRVGLTVRW